ncbi:MAG: Asp-tRNA(Asn)/Glu-tRNA(Gln) amidotransferase subunit GatC [Candidatus Zambryskibacteria bacterium]|nr:Asp-tRNA(Asn)/Glu-tRNA(Gln) amidotransferase subunit GatC [Candidatus Zambryskibacteria bacterium]
MITKKDIQNLANLARIEISETEAEDLTSEIDSILGYVGQVKNISADSMRETPVLKNVMREDVVTHSAREYTEDLLSSASGREGDYLKVKKIL